MEQVPDRFGRQFRTRRMGMALAAFACLLLQGCVMAGLESVKQEAKLSSSFVRPDDPQEDIGAREHPLVLAKYGGEYRDTEAEKVLALIVGRLISVSEDPARIFKVTILNTPKINAFALPGGYVYVTRGLLALANDSSEIAAVIAHEMSHVSANHAILRQERTTSAELGEKIVTDVLGDSVAARVALAANQLQLANFSREQELQADAIGIRMIGRAGFDPFAAARFLETMQAYQSLRSGRSETDEFAFLSSHPTTPQRIEMARRHARFFGAPGIGETGRDRYLDGINGMLYGDSADEGFVRGRVFAHSGLGIRFEVPQGTRLDNQPKAIMITGPGDAATRFDAVVLPPFTTLPAYLRSGWINGLKWASVKSTTVPGGFESASADAETEGWRFRVTVIRIGSQAYRFITAAPSTTPDVAAISAAIASTFRKMTDAEKSEIAPLRVRTIRFAPGDNLGSIVSRMKGTDEQLRMFLIMNSLKAGETPAPGARLKIIDDL